MFKANGRTHKTSVETARHSTGSKIFTCKMCGETKVFTNIEFGESPRCLCGEKMIEKEVDK